MDQQYGESSADANIRAKWKKSTHEYRISLILDIVTAEDLITADPWTMEFNDDRTEWAFMVISSVGFPRRTIGTLVLSLKDDGSLMAFLE